MVKNMEKKRKKRKIIGILSCVIAGLLGLLLILIAYAFSAPVGTTSAEVNWALVIPIIVVFVLFLLLGIICFCWERIHMQYEEYQIKREQRLQEKMWEEKSESSQKIEQLLSAIQHRREKRNADRVEKQKRQEEALEEKRRHVQQLVAEREEQTKELLDMPNLAVHQTARLYRNKNAGMAVYLTFAGSFLLAFASIAVIPAVVSYVEHLGIATIVLTITFWIGFFWAIFSYQQIKYTPQHAFVVSSANIIYYITFQRHNYGREPLTKIGSIIHGCRVREAETKLVEERKKYLESPFFIPMVERVINGKGEPEHECIVIKMNSPRIKRKGIFGIRIRYWKEEDEIWDMKSLTRANEGYEIICNIIEQRMQRYRTE